MADARRLNRSAVRTTPTRIRYEDSEAGGMEYGNGPIDLLERKFEETNSGPDENMYDDYARRELTDRTADKTLFQHEESRGAVNRSAGIIQSHYYGHRGCEEPDRPELFLGFAGPENADPRGINVDPDMRKYKAQAEARNRFYRMTPDDSANITGGGRSPGQLQADQQSLFRWARDQMKIFNRQMDGRREGMRRPQTPHVSDVQKVQHVQSYGDLMRDYALNPQRRANLICRQAIRDSRAYREGTADQDFAIAKYTQICRRAGGKQTFKRVLGAKNADDTVWTDGDSTVPYKTMGILMASIIAGRKTRSGVVGDSDRDYSDAGDVMMRKTAAPTRDLETIMFAIMNGTAFGDADETRAGKTAPRQQAAHLARVTVANHLTPAHHYINAEIIYKSLKQGKDLSRVQGLVDPDMVKGNEDMSRAAKSAKMRMLSGAKLATADDTDKADSGGAVMSYKSVKPKAPVAGFTDADARNGESDGSVARKTSNAQYRTTNTADVNHTQNMGDNAYLERRKAPMGTKYTMRSVDREGDSYTLSDLS